MIFLMEKTATSRVAFKDSLLKRGVMLFFFFIRLPPPSLPYSDPAWDSVL